MQLLMFIAFLKPFAEGVIELKISINKSVYPINDDDDAVIEFSCI